MQVYKVFFQILDKQKGLIIMYISIFLSICFAVSSQAVKNNEKKTFASESYKLAVFDNDNSELSKGLTAYLTEGNKIIKIEDSKESIQDELYNRNVNCVLRIPQGFMEEEKKIEYYTIPGTIGGETFENLVNHYLSLTKSYMAGGYTPKEAIEAAGKMAKEKVTVELTEEESSTGFSKSYYFFSYIPYIMFSICIIAIAPILIVFHRKEVRERIECSAYTNYRTNMELFAGTVTAGIGLCLLMFLMILAANGAEVLSVKGALHTVNMVTFLIVSLGATFLLGQIVKNRNVLSMISNVLALGMSFLSGIFVPLELLGDSVIAVARFLPSYWYIVAARHIDHYETFASHGELWGAVGIELLFGIALIAIGLAYSRTKMKSLSVA